MAIWMCAFAVLLHGGLSMTDDVSTCLQSPLFVMVALGSELGKPVVSALLKMQES